MKFMHSPERIVSIASFLVIISLFILPFLSPAAVREVTLFPQSAKIEGTTTAGVKTTVIVLPPLADPESLVVSLPAAGKIKVEDIQIKPVKRTDENKIAQLRAQIKKLQNDKKELLSRVHALDTQIQFWQAQTKAKTKSVTDADQLAAAIDRKSVV